MASSIGGHDARQRQNQGREGHGKAFDASRPNLTEMSAEKFHQNKKVKLCENSVVNPKDSGISLNPASNGVRGGQGTSLLRQLQVKRVVTEKLANQSDRETEAGLFKDGAAAAASAGKSFSSKVFPNIAATIKAGDVVIHTTCLDNSSLISVNSDRNHKRFAQKISNIELRFAARTDEDPDHLWSSSRNFNEVKYACQHSKDDKRYDHISSFDSGGDGSEDDEGTNGKDTSTKFRCQT